MVTSDLNAQGHINPCRKDFKSKGKNHCLKKRSYPTSSQSLLESEASWHSMTYAVLLLWPRRSREEAAHNQKQGNGRSPTDFVELWISLGRSLLTGRLTGLSSFSAGLFSIVCTIYLSSWSRKPYIYLYLNPTSSLCVGAKRCTQTCLRRN